MNPLKWLASSFVIGVFVQAENEAILQNAWIDGDLYYFYGLIGQMEESESSLNFEMLRYGQDPDREAILTLSDAEKKKAILDLIRSDVEANSKSKVTFDEMGNASLRITVVSDSNYTLRIWTRTREGSELSIRFIANEIEFLGHSISTSGEQNIIVHKRYCSLDLSNRIQTILQQVVSGDN